MEIQILAGEFFEKEVSTHYRVPETTSGYL
jgi:hypothetical protein